MENQDGNNNVAQDTPEYRGIVFFLGMVIIAINLVGLVLFLQSPISSGSLWMVLGTSAMSAVMAVIARDAGI